MLEMAAYCVLRPDTQGSWRARHVSHCCHSYGCFVFIMKLLGHRDL